MNAERLGVRGFRYQCALTDADGNVVSAWEDHNLIPQVGLDLLVRAPFGDAQPVANFYMGLMRNNTLPTSASTAADIPGLLGEFVQYGEANRPLWDKIYNGAAGYTNQQAPAKFTFHVDQTLYGAFLVSDDNKGGNVGTLLSVVRFNSPRQISAGLTLNVTASLIYLPS